MLQSKIDIATKDKKARAGAIEYDELLFEQLRTPRRRLAGLRLRQVRYFTLLSHWKIGFQLLDALFCRLRHAGPA